MSREELIALANESASEVGCNLTENKYVPTKLALLAQAFLEADAERDRLRFVEFQAGLLIEAFERLINTMEAINVHQGYPFSQPLIEARATLKKLRSGR